MHLPWEGENKVIAMFAFLKIPLIFFVGFFGLFAERQLDDLTKERWSRSALSGQPSCYVHKLDMDRAPKHTEWSLVQFINDTFMGGRMGEPKVLTVADLTLEVASRDLCGFDAHCKPDSTVSLNSGAGGMQHVISFSSLWFLYKIMYIGVHPVDRLVTRFIDVPPLLKLLTEPYFRPPCTKLMALAVKALFYLRYKVMPNLLLGALATLESHPACDQLVFYKMDWFWGNLMYYMICIDLFLTAALYGLGVYYGANPVGTWRYRAYKTVWFLSGFFPGVFVFFEVMTTSQWNIFKLIRFTFRCTFTFDISFAFYIDILQLFLFFISVFEFVEFVAFVCQILCPKFLERQPWFKAMDFDCCDNPGDEDGESEADELIDPVAAAATDGSSGGAAAASAPGGARKGKRHQLKQALSGFAGQLGRAGTSGLDTLGNKPRG